MFGFVEWALSNSEMTAKRKEVTDYLSLRNRGSVQVFDRIDAVVACLSARSLYAFFL